MNYHIRRDDNAQSANSESWERNTLREVLLETTKEQRRARIWKIIWRCIWLLVLLSFLTSLRNGNELTKVTGKHTAVINLSGQIGGGYEDQVSVLRSSLEAAYSNSNVKGIIIRANSPGGSPVVSNIAFQEILRLKNQHKNIPLYVVAEDMCASGCYYIAAAADKIYADPSSIVGSIGVIGGGFDFTGLMDKLGIKRRLRTAGENKGMGDPFTPETPAQKAIWEQMLRDIHLEFIKAVKTGRGSRLQDASNPDVFSGRVYTGNEAKKIGLIDDFGNIYSVARDVIQAPEIVDYTPEDQFSKFIGRRLGTHLQQGLQSLTDKTW